MLYVNPRELKNPIAFCTCSRCFGVLDFPYTAGSIGDLSGQPALLENTAFQKILLLTINLMYPPYRESAILFLYWKKKGLLSHAR